MLKYLFYVLGVNNQNLHSFTQRRGAMKNWQLFYSSCSQVLPLAMGPKKIIKVKQKYILTFNILESFILIFLFSIFVFDFTKKKLLHLIKWKWKWSQSCPTLCDPQESLSWKCSTWMQSQKWQNDLYSFPMQTTQYYSNPSLCSDQ